MSKGTLTKEKPTERNSSISVGSQREGKLDSLGKVMQLKVMLKNPDCPWDNST